TTNLFPPGGESSAMSVQTKSCGYTLSRPGSRAIGNDNDIASALSRRARLLEGAHFRRGKSKLESRPAELPTTGSDEAAWDRGVSCRTGPGIESVPPTFLCE